MKFEFDPAKCGSNKIKHGLDFAEAQQLWKNRRVEVAAKTEGGQIRDAVLGKIKNVHHIAIITYHGRIVRLISARKSSDKEIAIYEKYIEKT